jgi:hypothetical protein
MSYNGKKKLGHIGNNENKGTKNVGKVRGRMKDNRKCKDRKKAGRWEKQAQEK